MSMDVVCSSVRGTCDDLIFSFSAVCVVGAFVVVLLLVCLLRCLMNAFLISFVD